MDLIIVSQKEKKEEKKIETILSFISLTLEK